MSNLIDRLRLPFRKERELFSALYEMLGFYPKHINYYRTALLHRSMAMKNEKGRPINNERLEFLGDAILDAVVGDIVFHNYPKKREGFLTNIRSMIVSRKNLGRLATKIGLDKMVSNTAHNHTHNSYIGGNAFEALVGAIYLDRGYAYCRRFMEKRILSEMINIDKLVNSDENFKSKLLEWTQKRKVTLEFVLIDEGTENGCSPYFEYQVLLNGICGGIGRGYSKKESHQKAAHETLKMLEDDSVFHNTVLTSDN